MIDCLVPCAYRMRWPAVMLVFFCLHSRMLAGWWWPCAQQGRVGSGVSPAAVVGMGQQGALRCVGLCVGRGGWRVQGRGVCELPTADRMAANWAG
jgi:hypothetical protein